MTGQDYLCLYSKLKMGKVATNDLIVDSKGLCFFCLNPVNADNDKFQCSSSLGQSQPPSIHSVWLLSRYLKLDVRKVLHENVQTTSPHLLDKVGKSKLKAELCEDCHHINEQLTRLSLQAERIEMEIATYLERLSLKLEQVRRDSGPQTAASLEALFDKRKLEIMEMLREEAKVKCSHKLDQILPRIRLQKLSTKEVNQRIGTIQRNRSKGTEVRRTANEKIDKCQFKQETSHPNSSSKTQESCDDDFSVGAPLSPSASYARDDVDYEVGSDQDSEDSYHENANNSKAVQSQAVYAKSKVKIEDGDGCTSERNGCRIISLSQTATRTKIVDGTIMKNCIVNPVSGRHKCTKCFKEYSAYIGFYFHYRGEHLNMKYACSACGNSFTQMSNLNSHQRRVHRKVTFKCQGCSQLFQLESKLSTHDCTARKIAENLTDGAGNRKLGSSFDPKTRRHNCRRCPLDFATRQGCLRHLESVHTGVKYRCRKCNKVFSWRTSYNRHKRWKSCREKGKPRPHGRRQVCGKVCKSISGLEEHKAEHRPQNHKCHLCPRRFRCLSTLSRHRSRAHKGHK